MQATLQALVHPRLLDEIVPQNIANVLYGLAELQRHGSYESVVQQHVLCKLLPERALASLGDSNKMQVVPVMAGLGQSAAVGVCSKQFAMNSVQQLLGGRASTTMWGWNTRDVADVMRACAQLGLPDQHHLYRQFAQLLINRTDDCGVSVVTDTAWACEVLCFCHPDLMRCLLRRAIDFTQHRTISFHGKVHHFEPLSQNQAQQVGLTVVHAVAALGLQELASEAAAVLESVGMNQSTVFTTTASVVGDYQQLVGELWPGS